MYSIRPACYALALFIPFVAPAQRPAGSTAAGPPATFNVAVTTGDGRAVHGLTAQNFKLLDSKAEQTITSVKEMAAGQQPVHVILVVDAVNLPFSRVAFARDELDKFLKANGGKLSQPATIAIVTDKGAQISTGFTTDGNALRESFDKVDIGLREIRRDSGIWGADERVQISLTALRQLIAYGGTIPGRKAIVWVSPGWPLLSGARIDLDSKQQKQIFADVVSFSGQMQTANVTLYDVNPLGPEQDLVRSEFYRSFLKGVGRPGQVDVADLSLQVLAAQSGGVVSTSNSDVAGNLAKDIEDAATWYQVTANTAAAEQPDEYHHLQVTVDSQGVTARTRDGYYAQPR